MSRRTKTGRHLTDDDLDAIAAEVETTEYGVEELKMRRRETLGDRPLPSVAHHYRKDP